MRRALEPPAASLCLRRRRPASLALSARAVATSSSSVNNSKSGGVGDVLEAYGRAVSAAPRPPPARAPLLDTGGPRVHATLAAAQAAAHVELLAAVRRARAAPGDGALPLLLRVCADWWAAAGGAVMVAADAPDAGALLTEVADASGVPLFARWGPQRLAAELAEWADLRAGEAVPYAEVLGAVQSLVRYHRGVEWGGGAGDSEGGRRRRLYRLRPWHGVWCPEGAAQRPHVRVLQWLLDSPRADPAELWRRFGAAEAFERAALEGRPALDVGCQGGHAVDLLLKAGARAVLAVDAAAEALGSTEAAAYDHVREGRSGATAARVRAGDIAVSVRRCATAEGLASLSPAGLLWCHPPAPTALLPLRRLDVRLAAERSPWWADVRRAVAGRAAELGAEVPVLPQLWCPAAALGERCFFPPAGSGGEAEGAWEGAAGLRRLASALTGPAPPVAEGGYVAAVLPRLAGDWRAALQPGAGDGDGGALGDWLMAQLGADYAPVVMQRQHVHRRETPAAAASNMDLLRFVFALLQEQTRLLDGCSFEADVGAPLRRFLAEEAWVDVLVLRRQPRRRAADSAAAAAPSTQRPAPQRSAAECNGVTWEESFEHAEYKPRSASEAGGGAPTREHWTDCVPVYAHLEGDFFDEADGVESNFLATGHAPLLLRRPEHGERGGVSAPARTSEAAARARREAAERFRSVFGRDLQERRAGKLRKLALAPLEQQEWYIDEKLVRSEAAKVEFMNSLARWDLKDYD